MTKSPGHIAYLKAQRELVEVSDQIEIGKAWAGLRASDHWPVVEAWIAARIASRQNMLLMTDDRPSADDFIELRAETRLLYKLLRAGRESEQQLEQLRQRERDLREQINRGEMTGQSRDFSAKP